MSEIRKVQKLYNIDLQSVDEENRQITFCFSDDQPDRQGEIVDQSTWDVSNYMQNPVILWGHNPDDNENVLGQGVSLDLNRDGKSFITAQFDDAQTNPKADMIFRQLIKRTLRTVSAGFISHTFEWNDDTPVLKDNELLEVSVVAIPANPRAIARSLKDGSISRKDATWMLDSMRKEAAELEKELAKPDNQVHKEENVEEIKTQLSAVTDALAKVAETLNTVSTAQATQAETLANLNGTVSELKTVADEAASKAAEDVAKATADAEAKAADEAAQKAQEEAAEPKEENQTAATETATADSETTAADEKTKEDAADETDVSDAAKDGEIDQSGAVTETFDETAELTPELQAQIDSALEQTLTTTAA